MLINQNHQITGVLEGISKGANIITSTLGGAGKNVLMFKNGGLAFTKDGVSVARELGFTDVENNIGAKLLIDACNKTVSMCGDGPQPLYSKILTPNGWTTMGEVEEGDIICSVDGKFQIVEGVFEKGEREIYEVRFMDGRVVECCEDHLWTVFTNNGKQLTTTTKNLIESNKIYVKKGSGVSQYGYYVPIAKVDFQEKELPIDPYLLGLILGDGSISTRTIKITLALHEDFILEKLPAGLKHSVAINPKKNCLNITLNGKEIRNKLKELGLFGKKSGSKFIPDIYLYNSKHNRKKLLEGLLDSDGHINKKDRFEYSTISKNLYKGFCELVRGLGYSIYTRIHFRDNDKSSYSQTPIYRITQLKGYKYGNKIVSILPTGTRTQMRCIKVSNENNLYVTDNYVVTHNTTLTSLFVKEFTEKLFKEIENGAEVNDLLDSTRLLIADVASYLKAQAKQIESTQDVYNIAFTSCKNPKLATLIQNVYKKSGLDARITLNKSTEHRETYVEHTEGLTMYDGMINDYFANQDDGSCVFEKPEFWIEDKYFNLVDEIKEVLDDNHTRKVPLVIIGKNFSQAVIQHCLRNKVGPQNLQICLVKLPGFGSQAIKENIADMKVFITNGSANRVHITRETITIYNNPAKQSMKRRLAQLEAKAENATEEFDQRDFLTRIANLQQKSAIIHVGGITEKSRDEEYDRIEDAIGAVKSATVLGYVPGTGLSLFKYTFSNVSPTWFNSVLQTPFEKILNNANIKALPIEPNGNAWIPFNVRTKQYDESLIDPVYVIITALENSFALAELLVNVSYVLYD